MLVVDDNATNRRILHEQLSSWGMENRGAQDGRRALELLRAAVDEDIPYDLAVLDMQMPGMDGMELARRIKKDPAISPTRLVLLTSMGYRGEGGAARQAGIDAYLTKPIRQSELHGVISTVMGMPTEEPGLVTRHTLREGRPQGRPRVLLVEDNAVNQKVAVRMLEKLGHRVDVASDGVEALAALVREGGAEGYAAVLMDVQMPEMDGYEATREIRHRETRASQRRVRQGLSPSIMRIPIIAMTANAMRGDREKAIEAGMDDYLTKPVRQDELDEVLARWVGRRSEEEPAAQHPDEDGPALEEAVLAGLRKLQGEGDPDIIRELAEIFLEDAPARIAEIRASLESGDAGGVERAAHTLKGGAGNMGASRMSRLAAGLQEAGHGGDLSEVPGLLRDLEAELDRVRGALEEELSANGGA